MNQAVFQSLEQATRGPLNVLSYLYWFMEATKHCLSDLQQTMESVDQAAELNPNFVSAVQP